ncbi:hypothetical protein M758_UG146300 [Ceratodon purpureus]|nr:hypothetical protein M758_UG146300 [Ceratodon purpureus]
MARYDMKVRIEAEEKECGWSPLFMDLILVPLPPYLQRPFKHTEGEFHGLLAWLEREGKAIGDCNLPPHMARAFKLFAKSEVGDRMPMLCLVRGLTQIRLLDKEDQVYGRTDWRGKDLLPNSDIEGEDFQIFCQVLDCRDNQGGQVEKFTSWRRKCFVRACCDTLRQEKENILQRMRVCREWLDEEGTTAIFRNILLLRENIDLGYVFRSLEATRVWPRGRNELFEALKVLLRESVSACHTKLSYCTVIDDLEDLDDFRASQVLCTFDASRFSGQTESLPSKFSGQGGSPLRGNWGTSD